MPALGDRLRVRRRELGLTASAVAAHIGISRSYMSQIEHDDKAPSRPLLARLAEVLQCDEGELLLLAQRAVVCPHCGALVANVRWSKYHEQEVMP